MPPSDGMESRLYGTVLPISETGTLRDAQEILQMHESTLSCNRRRSAQLKDALLDRGPISKHRRPYGIRGKVRLPKNGT